MKFFLVLSFIFGVTQTGFAQTPIYQQVFNNVSQSHLQELLKNMTGVNPVTVDGKTFSITDRYLPASKANFRSYWTSYFKSLGIPVQEFAYPTAHTSSGETNGHNLEAVLKGKSPDSIIIIVHYDSMGITGSESTNPAVDDDMTGMAMLMETARILSQIGTVPDHTVRFVAADYEEWSGPGLEGARVYAKYINDLAAKENFSHH